MRRHRERGASLPETAIVIGVLLTLILGIVEFGRLLYTYSFVAQIAREGARWATVRGSACSQLDHCNAQQSDVQTYVQSLSEGLTNTSSILATLQFTACPPGQSGNTPGCSDQVTVTYPYQFSIVPLLANVTVNMSSTSQMVISN